MWILQSNVYHSNEQKNYFKSCEMISLSCLRIWCDLLHSVKTKEKESIIKMCVPCLKNFQHAIQVAGTS